MNEPLSHQDEQIRQAADRLFATASHYSELTRERVLALAGGNLGWRAFKRVFPGTQFTDRRNAWLRERIEQALEAAFAQAVTQDDVTYRQIAEAAGCSIDSVKRLVGGHYRARLDQLSTSQQQAITVIERLVEARIPLQEYTWARVFREVGKPGRMYLSSELTTAFRDGRETLVRYHQQQQQQRLPGATYACIGDDWINVDESAWYLPALGRTLRRDSLRPDIAAIAWLLLREEALIASPSPHTLYVHHQSCLFVAKILGDTIPDIRALTLETLQQAWFATSASEQMQRHGRTMLVRMLEALIAQTPSDDSQQVYEYARAIQWLEMLRLKEPDSAKVFLSEAEFDAVLDACLEDIIEGLAYVQRNADANQQVTIGMCTQDAEAVLHWGIALIILIMAFTGLRRQSVARLALEDVAKLGPHAYALAWRHGKPGKQRIAIIPALVAEHLQYYIQATAPIRAHLGTQRIFLARNTIFRWDRMTVTRVSQALTFFERRHALARNGVPLRLGSTLLRRTYVTRALYELPSIAALQAQLGHNNPRTTLIYAQHDRVEHPAQVGEALDTFGRKVLVRWYKPLLLQELPDAERQMLLGARVAHEQNVGMCRHNRCIKLDEERLPPCSLCEHLVSGVEYLDAWEREKQFREQQLEHFSQTPGAELLFAQMKGQYDRFLVNYRFIQERSQA